MLYEFNKLVVFESFQGKPLVRFYTSLGESSTIDDSIWWLIHRNVLQKLQIDYMENKSKPSGYDEENVNYESDSHHV